MANGGYKQSGRSDKAAILGGTNTMNFMGGTSTLNWHTHTRGVRLPPGGVLNPKLLADAGMKLVSPRMQVGAPGKGIPSARFAESVQRGGLGQVEQRFKSWLSGSNTGRQELWTHWHTIDFNGNGVVSYAEIEKWIDLYFPQLKHKGAMMRAYRASDCNKDGFVTKTEFPMFLRNVIYFNKLWNVYDRMDANRDRRLTYSEFEQGFAALGLDSAANPREVFDSLDRNRGGMVLFDEFAKWAGQALSPIEASVHSPTAGRQRQVSDLEASHQKEGTMKIPTASSPLPQVPPAGTTFEYAEAKIRELVKDKRDLQVWWRKMDYNGNGILSLAEIEAAIRDKAPALDNSPVLLRAYKATFRQGDGFVHKSEFRALLRNVLYFNKCYRLFELADGNHDRKLDHNEFRSGCVKLGLRLTPDEAFDEFNFMDHNGGGKVLFDEFCKWASAKKLPID
eukprot:TRINITY_DN38951_c0_g1_i1.p1 TRINITY_DN38951_c0_g1~~TRINITY_DN38951_c0_g1_i1.p1  ORF type:complete len:450 (+),score=94.54 TRINITY_DN38951_c0_g1_i1:59-1408(+)